MNLNDTGTSTNSTNENTTNTSSTTITDMNLKPSTSSACSSGTTTTTSVKKADNFDDIFQLICGKMSTLSTDGSGNRTELVQAFVSVLVCSEIEATFFLESANWDVANVSSLIGIWVIVYTMYVSICLSIYLLIYTVYLYMYFHRQ